MSGVANFLRNYEFLNLTKSVTESQMALYKMPTKTWGDVGNKLYSASLYNTLSIGAVGADVATYLAVSTLRGIGLFRPLPPQPPVFQTPHDNAQFIDCAVKRALWDWDPVLREEFEEGIESSLSEKWNIFQVVGEWSLAYSLENREKSSYFKPTFLTISEPLENGASFLSIGKDFAKLWQSEQKKILEALYHQSPAPSLGSKGKKVYQDLRATASKLHHGNQIYLTAFSEYVKQKEAAAPSPPPYQPVSERPPAYAPSYSAPAYTSVYPQLPSAPPLRERVGIVENVAILRNAVQNLPSQKKNRLRSEIMSDFTNPLDRGSPKALVASLSLLHDFKVHSLNPTLLPLETLLRSGKSFRDAGREFYRLREGDFTKLRDSLVEPYLARSLSVELQDRLNDLNEFGRMLVQTRAFQDSYEALKIDLVVR